MAKIVNLFNGGKRSRKTGVVNINSKNVYPTQLTATAATATTLSLDLLDAYEFFNCAQTSAATDKLAIPSGADVGTQIIIKSVGTSFGVIRSGSDTINGVSTIVTLAANATAVLLKVSSTAWILTHYATSGAITSPTT